MSWHLCDIRSRFSHKIRPGPGESGASRQNNSAFILRAGQYDKRLSRFVLITRKEFGRAGVAHVRTFRGEARFILFMSAQAGGLTRCRKRRVSLHRSREKLWKLFVFTGCIFLCLYRFRNIPRNSTHISERAKLTSVSVQNEPFLIIVLAMDRVEALTNLLTSLENTNFLGQRVQLEIHFDKSPSGTEASRVAEEFIFSHGPKKIFVSSVQKGLANSWYTAYEGGPDDRPFIILEDDIVLSPHWFLWCSQMLERYHTRPDLAGISLQRQTLIPKLPSHSFVIVNNRLPYLYALVGSIGF